MAWKAAPEFARMGSFSAVFSEKAKTIPPLTHSGSPGRDAGSLR